ncbi:MAG: hypothetical protein ABFQ62_02845 [Patescibacteria group bacterium]
MRFKFKFGAKKNFKIILNSDQRKHLADLFKDSANVFLASLVVGQFVIEKVRYEIAFLGLLLYISLIILTTKLRKENHE